MRNESQSLILLLFFIIVHHYISAEQVRNKTNYQKHSHSLETDSTKLNRFKQNEFVIGFWVDPPANEYMDYHYADIAAANFSLVIGGFGAKTPETIKKQIALCEKYGLKVIVKYDNLNCNEPQPNNSLWGYILRDEPSANDFPELRKTVDKLREVQPGMLSYINLFPDYANENQLGTSNYEEYVKKFVEEVDVDILSMDHYPRMTPQIDTREEYCNNLNVMRKYSLYFNIPFWNFFNTMPFRAHYDPTEAQLRWQIYTSLAYGAKGILYFCYWTPPGKEFLKGGAIITAEGRKTRHYDQAKRINHELKSLGSTLMQLTSLQVFRIKPEEEPNEVLMQTPIKNMTKGDYLIGFFRHADGRLAILVNNYSFAYTAWPTIEFNVPADQIKEICKDTGQEIEIIDDSPALNGLQISLDSGDGRLFLLNEN